MDAIAVLTNDHRHVESLFETYEQASDDDARAEAVASIVRELSVHAGIEETLLYPLLRAAAPDGGPMADHARSEHQDIKEALKQVERLEVADPQLDALLQHVMQMVGHHVDEEEGELFPALRNTVDAEQLERVGSAMEAAKSVAPTHPHPNAPSSLPGHLVVDPATIVLDKARDLAASLFSH